MCFCHPPCGPPFKCVEGGTVQLCLLQYVHGIQFEFNSSLCLKSAGRASYSLRSSDDATVNNKDHPFQYNSFLDHRYPSSNQDTPSNTNRSAHATCLARHLYLKTSQPY